MLALDLELLSIPRDPTYVPFLELLRERRLIIYGAGGLFASFDRFVLQRFGRQADLLIDRKFLGFENVDQISPETFFAGGYQHASLDDLVLICLGDVGLLAEIQKRFNHLGFRDVRSALEIYEYNLIYSDPEFANDPVSLYRREWEKLIHVYSLFRDNLSKETYYKYLRAHVERKRPNFAPATYATQYTPPDLPLIQNRIRLLNAGAFSGDTIENFVRNYGARALEFVLALEPDPENFEKLIRNDIVRRGCGSYVLLPLAASDVSASTFFESGRGMISRFSENPSETNTLVRTVRLDSVVRGMRFNKIVVDTEGHEMAILRGMRELIEDEGPDICIACYHHPEDIYSIALLIEEIQPRYRFFLRNHSSVCVDTVLYATLEGSST